MATVTKAILFIKFAYYLWCGTVNIFKLSPFVFVIYAKIDRLDVSLFSLFPVSFEQYQSYLTFTN
ncbi:MAG: hypothetical protein ACP5IZ_10465, partial [Thermoprotei archaeon]